MLSWVLVLGGLRAIVVQAEHCGDPTAEELAAAADSAVGWFVRNQRDDGAWLYRYDRDTDTDVGGYNITRHAGVTMSLEQAAGAGLATSAAAAASAERGIGWALDRLYEGPGWRAFAGEGDGPFGSGASALLTAALVLRRERTGDERYDDVIGDLGAFLTAMVNERGQVYGQYDRAAGAAVPDSWSKYFTGETFWALTLLHRAFPDGGYGDAAERIAHYIATERREVEGLQPDLPGPLGRLRIRRDGDMAGLGTARRVHPVRASPVRVAEPADPLRVAAHEQPVLVPDSWSTDARSRARHDRRGAVELGSRRCRDPGARRHPGAAGGAGAMRRRCPRRSPDRSGRRRRRR